MFTLEESALLGRMLRVVGWLAVCLTVGVAGCAVFGAGSNCTSLGTITPFPVSGTAGNPASGEDGSGG